MTKAIFFFICSVLLLSPVIYQAGDLSPGTQVFCCLPFLLFLGIPHGAIDHVLYKRNNKVSNLRFISTYLFFIGINIILWIILPSVAYLIFLLISAYHFGQSQFTHYFANQKFIDQVFFLMWGTAILSGLVYFNLEEIFQIMANYQEFSVFSPLHQPDMMLAIFTTTSGAVILMMLVYLINKSLKLEAVLMELIILGLILLCFYLMPLVIGFTLYFVILHSFKVLREEYYYLHTEKVVNSAGQFIKLVAPFTLVSIAGIGLLFVLTYLEVWTLSYGYILLIVISSITLPHVYVMNQFYDFLFNIGFFKYLGKSQ